MLVPVVSIFYVFYHKFLKICFLLWCLKSVSTKEIVNIIESLKSKNCHGYLIVSTKLYLFPANLHMQ